jgi:hypothetical protein
VNEMLPTSIKPSDPKLSNAAVPIKIAIGVVKNCFILLFLN